MGTTGQITHYLTVQVISCGLCWYMQNWHIQYHHHPRWSSSITITEEVILSFIFLGNVRCVLSWWLTLFRHVNGWSLKRNAHKLFYSYRHHNRSWLWLAKQTCVLWRLLKNKKNYISTIAFLCWLFVLYLWAEWRKSANENGRAKWMAVIRVIHKNHPCRWSWCRSC